MMKTEHVFDENQQIPSLHLMLEQGAVLISQVGWGAFSLAMLAEKMRIPPGILYRQIASKDAFLWFFMQHITAETLQTIDVTGLDNARDKIFEGVMQRLDTWLPYKPMLNVLSYELPQDPLCAIRLVPKMAESFDWILSLAGISTTGMKGLLKLKAFGVFYGLIVAAWLKDDSPDQGQTLKALDLNLDRFMPVFLL